MKVLFAAADPGARNHLEPLRDFAVSAGYTVDFAALPTGGGVGREPAVGEDVRLLVTGCSTGCQEWAWIREGKNRGVPTAMVVEIGLGYRFESVGVDAFPDRFLATNQACADEISALGGHATLVGSAHLERLAGRGVACAVAEVRAHYGLAADHGILSFFGAPDDGLPDALAMVVQVWGELGAGDAALVVRVHPRSTDDQVGRLEEVCKGVRGLVLDLRRDIDTPSLVAASTSTLTMGSTVSLESMVMGVPSAFLQCGWDYHELERIFANVPFVPRIRSAGDCASFVGRAFAGERMGAEFDIEHWDGALERSWAVIEPLFSRGGN